MDRRRKQGLEGELSVPAMRRLHALHEAAHQRGAAARLVGAVHLFIGTHAHGAGDGHGVVLAAYRIPAGVEGDDLVAGSIVVNHRQDAEVAHHRARAQGDLGERGGHRRIDRSPPLPQRLETRPVGQRMITAGDCAAAAPGQGVAGKPDFLHRQVLFPFPGGPAGRGQVDLGSGGIRRGAWRNVFLRTASGQGQQDQRAAECGNPFTP